VSTNSTTPAVDWNGGASEFRRFGQANNVAAPLIYQYFFRFQIAQEVKL